MLTKINIWSFIKTYLSRYTTFKQNTRQYSVMPNLIFGAERKKRHYRYLLSILDKKPNPFLDVV